MGKAASVAQHKKAHISPERFGIDRLALLTLRAEKRLALVLVKVIIQTLGAKLVHEEAVGQQQRHRLFDHGTC